MKNSRQFAEDQLVIATHNKGKLREIQALFDGFGFRVISAGSLGLAEPEETETSFQGNALLKARAAATAAKLPALADDSGLVVAALNGAPGIYSARWAQNEGGRDFDHAMRRVADALLMTGSSDRSAEFVCALSLAWPDGHTQSFEGRVGGTITWPPRGDQGFGYDPIFVPSGHQITFAEMAPAKKHAMSHRAVAFDQLVSIIKTASL